MKYERLTKKIRGYYHGKRFAGGKGVINDGKYYRGCFDATAIVDRLGELEDKIESGELIERTSEEYSAVRKQAVKEFAHEFKRRYFFMMATYMKDPIYQCTGDELDRFIKEVCGE